MTEPTFTVAQAAHVCAVSDRSIRRKIPLLHQNGAQKINGVWLIPLSALLASDLHPGNTTSYDKASDNKQVSGKSVIPNEMGKQEYVNDSNDIIATLEAKVSELNLKLDKWQTLADEREKTIDYLQLSLRAITEASKETTNIHPNTAPAQNIPQQNDIQRKKRWWQRKS